MSEDLYRAMQDGKPLASYIKACVGKVSVRILDPFSQDKEVELIVEGNPFTLTDKTPIILDVWTPKEKIFFERRNSYHLKSGNVIPYSYPTQPEKEVNYNSASTEDIETILSQPFFTLKSALGKMTSSAAINRVLNRARDLEKSEKIIAQIEERLAEVQEIENPLLKKSKE